MHLLLAQITNIFAAQSINPLQNSNIDNLLSGGEDFSHMLETLGNDAVPANFAMFNSQSLPSTAYTPVSIHVSQFAFLTQPSALQHSLGASGKQSDTSVASSSSNINSSGRLPIFNHFDAASEAGVKSGLNMPAEQMPMRSDIDKALDRIIDNRINIARTPEVVAQMNDIVIKENDLSQVQDAALSKLSTLSDAVENTYVNMPVINAKHMMSNNAADTINVEIEEAISVSQINKAATESLSGMQKRDVLHTMSQANTGILANEKSVNQHVNVTDNALHNQDIKALNNPSLNRVEAMNNEAINKDTAQRTEANPVVGSQSQPKAINSTAEMSAQKNIPEANLYKPKTDLISENTANKPIYNVKENSDTRYNDTSYRNERTVYQTSQTQGNYERYLSIAHNEQSGSDVEFSSLVNKGPDSSTELKNSVNQFSVEKSPAMNVATDSVSSANKLLATDKSVFNMASSAEVKNGEELAQQITWAKHNNANHVKISLSPEHLGALEINIEKDRDGFNIQFTTQNALAKDALETYLPRLRDMLEQQGLNLQNANVSQQGANRNTDSYNQAADQYDIQESNSNRDDSTEEPHLNQASSQHNYLLEAFA